MNACAKTALILSAISGFAANVPRFQFTINGSGTIAVAMDSRGNTYLTGPGSVQATPGAYQSQNRGSSFACPPGGRIPIGGQCSNAFVIKLDPSGAVVFATYLGGTGDAASSAIAVDSEGNVYVAGSIRTFSGPFTKDTFPVTPGAA